MKPPLRPRLLPSRFTDGTGSTGRAPRAPWGPREKRALLAELRIQARNGFPEPLLGALRERLPRRSEEEIWTFLVRLRGRAAREALTSKFRNFLQFQRRIRAPIEVWQELAQTLGGALEGPPSAAFSQVLTVAATEPLTLNHSRAQNSGISQNSGTPLDLGSPSDLGDLGGFEVDFGRVYEFLARLSVGGEGPPLSPAESAVVLSLLGALPAELGALGELGALERHFRGVWGALSAPSRDPPTPNPEPQKSPWAGAGLCPLNLFLVPLGLLGRALG